MHTTLPQLFLRAARAFATGAAVVLACNVTAVAQDECTTAVVINDGFNGPFSNATATNSLPAWPCGSGGSDLWFRYTATCCGNLTVNTCGATFDTVVQAFSGNAGCGGIVALGCNDDSTVCGTFALQSQVGIPVVIGSTYYIRVGGFSGQRGNFSLNVSCTVAPIANDGCAGAITTNLGINGPFHNFCSTTSNPAWPCGTGGNDVWYSFTPNCTAPHSFMTCGASFDTVIQVFNGAAGCAGMVSVGCNDNAPAGGPCGLSLQSHLQANLTNGVPYFIRVGGANGATGTFDLRIQTGTGLGSIAMTTASACTVPGLALALTGNPSIGGTIAITMTGHTGLPFVTWGFAAAPVLAPTCPCMILSIATGWQFAATTSLTVPCDGSFIGLPLEAQGADLFGAPAACGFIAPSAFTDVYTATIG